MSKRRFSIVEELDNMQPECNCGGDWPEECEGTCDLAVQLRAVKVFGNLLEAAQQAMDWLHEYSQPDPDTGEPYCCPVCGRGEWTSGCNDDGTHWCHTLHEALKRE